MLCGCACGQTDVAENSLSMYTPRFANFISVVHTKSVCTYLNRQGEYVHI